MMIRLEVERYIYFIYADRCIILINIFAKKAQKTLSIEIDKALRY